MTFKDLLVIVPHPDDESAHCGGLILRALRKSLRVRVVFLTSGAHGRTLGLVDQKALGAERKLEAQRATGVLGATEVFFLGYDDYDPRSGKKYAWPGARRKLLPLIGPVSASTLVVSFPPNGINGHPDHVRCAAFATALAKDKGAGLLYFATAGEDVSYPGQAVYMAPARRRQLHVPPTHLAKLTPAELEGKLLALSCYRTQSVSVLDFIRRSDGRISEEYFSLAGARRRDAQAVRGLLQSLRA